MSLINDALKRAQQNPARGPQNDLPPLPPVRAGASAGAWLIPAIVIFLIVAAIFIIGWGVAQHSVPPAPAAPPKFPVAPPATVAAPPPVAPLSAPATAPALVPLNPPDAPKLQGIFYSPAASTAIVDGKTVRLGDHFLQYRVTEITRSTVTLVDLSGQAVKLGMQD